MTDIERLERLYARQARGIKPGLGVTRALMAALGNPDAGLPVVHIAGTNGKGSVAAMLSSVLCAAGYRTGLYTSPHLVKFNERFVLDGAEIPDGELNPLLAEVEDAAMSLEKNGGAAPTFFECATAAAALWFKRKNTRILVAETGMGGRLDSTNVFSPVLTVITRIGMDHREYLGDTLEKIAAEKAGIIKPGIPTVCGAMPPEALAVIRRIASEVKAPVFCSADEVSVVRKSGDLRGQKVAVESQAESYGAINMRLAASYQTENMATAVAALEKLRPPAPADAVKRGLAAAEWKGRFQLISENPPVLIDGAHNPDGAAALVRALRDAKAGRRLPFVVGMCADKDVDGFFAAISPLCGSVRTLPLGNPRAESPRALADAARRRGIADAVPFDSLEAALADAKAEAAEAGKPVIVCGSLFLVGECLAARA